MPSYLELQGVVKRFGDVTAVRALDLRVDRGELFALLGSSGCGKSTLLRILAGLETATAGRVLLDGTDITALAPYERPINMMFQSYALFPHMSVARNVAFGLRQERMAEAPLRERVEQMLDLVQMGSFADRMPHQLSGGQQQRVALARSLAKHPKVLLLDEPLAALDKKIRQRTRAELLAVIRQVGVTCVLVTHDQEEAMSMADRIGVMTDGRLAQIGTPREIYERPSTRFTADFIGDTNLFSGTVTSKSAEWCVISVPDVAGCIEVGGTVRQSVGQRVWISIRPERVEFRPDPLRSGVNTWQGKVSDVSYLGANSLFEVELRNRRKVKAAVPTAIWGMTRPPAHGDSVLIGWTPDACTVVSS